MIRVAILGAGIGREHLEAYRSLPDKFDVTLMVDQDLSRIDGIRDGDTFKSAQTLSAAYDDPDIDLIDICLPPHLHVSVTLAALNAGKHVICEKPLAMNLADIDRIKSAANRSGCTVFPVFQYRWGPSHACLRALIKSGLAGRPQVASLETHWSRDADYYSVPWRGTWAGEQGGAILSHAIHNHDLMTHFMGPVAAVSAMTTTRVNEIETEDCAALAFAMSNGALCTSSVTLGAAKDETRLRFVFENLTATSGTAPYAPGSEPWTFCGRTSDIDMKINNFLKVDCEEPVGFSGMFLEISKAIAGQENTAPTLDDGKASVQLVTAIYHAARTGARIELPIKDDNPLYQGWQP